MQEVYFPLWQIFESGPDAFMIKLRSRIVYSRRASSCPPTTLRSYVTHSGERRIRKEHLGHVYGDGSFEGFPTIGCVFHSMGRWEPTVHPCAFHHRFSCTRGRRSAGMHPGFGLRKYFFCSLDTGCTGCQGSFSFDSPLTF